MLHIFIILLDIILVLAVIAIQFIGREFYTNQFVFTALIKKNVMIINSFLVFICCSFAKKLNSPPNFPPF
ncbi:hypothetical protein VCHA30O60_10561 [Vibrio chagasii]|nr:hypothetical protein VCHA30O60_10561 [Vibrio chagasii]